MRDIFLGTAIVLTLGLLIWRYGFQYYRMGDAAAISVVLFAIILSLTVIQLWLSRTRPTK